MPSADKEPGSCLPDRGKTPAAASAQPNRGTEGPKESQPLGWEERIDAIHATGCDDWLTAAWAAMLIRQGIVPEKDAPAVGQTLLMMLAEPEAKRTDGWTYFHRRQKWLDDRLGRAMSGNLMVVRTTPPARQTVFVRYHLMKCMCRIYDMLEAVLDMAQTHAATIMPGYTHSRHAQPTTFGHYLLSVFDAVSRSSETLERGYHLMSLNEMGCGALAGTSWPVDRDLVSEYLGMEGLIENANDAVSYTDGYLVVVCGLANVTNIISRLALDLAFWSGTEFGFLDVGSHGKSFLMPQKETNPNSLETVRLGAGKMIGYITAVAVAGLREPHGDGHGMLHLEDATLDALETAGKCIPIITREMHQTKVNPDRMKAVIETSYIASTELANQMVRDHQIDYRTAHDIIYRFVIASREAGIPANQARTDMLEEAAQAVTGTSLGMSQSRLRTLLDPNYFVAVTSSKGGVAPQEMSRMLADRSSSLQNTRNRHVARIERLEQARSRLESDLKAAAGE